METRRNEVGSLASQKEHAAKLVKLNSIFKTTTQSNDQKELGCGATGTLTLVDGKAEWDDHFGKVWQFHIRLNTHLPYHLVIPRLGIHPREEKIYVHTETYM